MVGVLFVCLGNICRSPTAEAVFTHHVHAAELDGKIRIDSAGTGNWHVGNPPDPRMIEAASKRSFDLTALRARQVCAQDFDDFDYLLAMDFNNLKALHGLAAQETKDRARLFLDFATDKTLQEVPDPYYGGAQGFEDVLDLVEDASQGLLYHIRKTHRL